MTSAPSPWRPYKAPPRQSSATSPVRFVANEARCGRSGHMASIDIDFLLVCAQRAPFISRLRQHLMMQLRQSWRCNMSAARKDHNRVQAGCAGGPARRITAQSIAGLVRQVDPPPVLVSDPRRGRLHVFGHNHASAGAARIGPTLHINASMVNSKYAIAHTPVELDLEVGNQAPPTLARAMA